MNILVSSHAFAPSLGGIETVSALLAEEFVKLGHAVVIVTQSQGEARQTEFGAPIERRPSPGRLLRLVKWCDVFWQNNLSIRTIWPAFALSRSIVITHQGSYCERPHGLDLALRIKHTVANRVTSVAISKFVASCFKTPSLIIPNPYNARLFTTRSTANRSQDLIFVGRAVSEKGIDLLLESLRILGARGLHPDLTVIGSGPELMPMKSLAQRLKVQEQVNFVGARNAAEIAEILNQHRILVVPSRYAEPFGIVAVEGIACGCAVVGSSGGGLPEAIGPCGLTFKNGDADALAQSLERLLSDAGERAQLTAHAPEHLAQFHPTRIANSYLNLFSSKLQ